MIGIAIATATAGIVVGTITLTGLGLMMTDFVEFISGGNVIVMLLLIAVISLVLGMGIPTTANYILVATLMAPVVVELGAQAGLAIPLIAVHLFVFYFGIMADITPPVGLAAFAAAAISQGRSDRDRLPGRALFAAHRDPAVRLHLQPGNPADRHRQLVASHLGDLRLAGGDPAVLGRDHELVHRPKSRLWESRRPAARAASRCSGPAWWLDQFYPPYVERPAVGIADAKCEQAPDGPAARPWSSTAPTSKARLCARP